MQDSNSLKSKTITGLLWSFADLLANHGIQFIIQIILARLLLPQHFGIIGLVLVFIVIANSIVDSGFSQALIRDQNTSQVDYSTVFYFNILVALVMYGILFNFSNAISAFFGEPQLTKIIKIISLVLIINSLGIIQKVILIKNIDFRTITKISIVAATISGGITITLAILGYGVWSLVINIIAMQFVQMLLLWIFNKWIPSITFSLLSFKKFFVFGYKLLLSGLIDSFYNNILFLIIGKFYSSTQLGFYTNAVKFRDLATLSITASVQRVSYPILSSIQEDEQRLKSAFKMLIKTSAFINFPLMIGLVVIANPLFNLLLGEKWIPSVIYFQLLCLAGLLFPLHAINLNILQVKGRSDLFLLLEIIKKTVLTLLIVTSLLWGLGIVGLIGATVINSYISLFINAYYSSREIDYSAKEQLRDLMPVFLITLFMGVIVSVSGLIITENHFIKLIFQICIGLVVYVTVSKLAKVQELWIVYRLISSIFTKLKV